ncbi:MAG: protein kinase domain-containing protein [Myxococcota bacterium]
MSGPADFRAASAQARGIWEGQVLARKYRVERVLGVGGMGIVVAAHHLQLDERVAIKLLHPHVLTHPKAISRFSREARAAAKIKSEHAAWVSDVGSLEDGTPYMVMEYLEGQDLAAWLRERGPLSWSQTSEFLLQACEALAVAHASGIVHRDLKPANLFITRRVDSTLCLKVLDFGISRVESDVSMTQTLQVLGSPLYMSPEQLANPDSVDARSDVWSLGIILFELTSGVPPFTAATLPDLVAKIMTEPPPALPGPSAPALEGIIQRCLEKDPSLRYPSVAELGRALLPFAPASGSVSVERIERILRTPSAEPIVASQPRSGTKPGVSRKRRWMTAVLTSAALVSLGVSGALIVSKLRKRAEVTTNVAAEAPEAIVTAPSEQRAVAPSVVREAPAPAKKQEAPVVATPRPARASVRAARGTASVEAVAPIATASAAPAEPPPPEPPVEPSKPSDPFEHRK